MDTEAATQKLRQAQTLYNQMLEQEQRELQAQEESRARIAHLKLRQMTAQNYLSGFRDCLKSLGVELEGVNTEPPVEQEGSE